MKQLTGELYMGLFLQKYRLLYPCASDVMA